MRADLPSIRLCIRARPSRNGRYCYIPTTLYGYLAAHRGVLDSERLPEYINGGHGCPLLQYHFLAKLLARTASVLAH